MNPLPPIVDLVPQKGRMCLLQEIVRWDGQGVACRSASHLDPANPLRRDGRLAGAHLVEYGAQAMAVHGGLLAAAAGAAAPPGMLSGLRDLELLRDRIDDLDGALEVEAHQLLAQPGGWLYRFSVECRGQLLARGRIAVILRVVA